MSRRVRSATYLTGYPIVHQSDDKNHTNTFSNQNKQKLRLVRFMDDLLMVPSSVHIPEWAHNTNTNNPPDFEPNVFKSPNGFKDTTDQPLADTTGRKVRQFFIWNETVCSIYSCMHAVHNLWGMVTEPLNCVILLMSGGYFAGAVYRNSEMVIRKEFVAETKEDHKSNRTTPPRSSHQRQTERKILNDIRDLLKQWDQHIKDAKGVYLRCASHHRSLFFEESDIDQRNSKYQYIPFMTGRPTFEEITKVYERLTTVIIHGDEPTFLEHLHKNEGKYAKIEYVEGEIEIPSFVPISRAERQMEKQKWPTLDAGMKHRIHEAILENDYDLLKDITEDRTKTEIADYLSAVHDKLGYQTFMHFAAKHDLDNTVDFLLDFYCDPTIKDCDGRVPYEYCKTPNMQSVFKKFRANNPDQHVWLKACIPEPLETSPRPKNADEVEKPKKRNEVKERRKNDKESKRVYRE